MSILSYEKRLREQITELRMELAEYQSSNAKQPRIDKFIESYLEPLIYDIQDLRMGVDLNEKYNHEN